ncbi:hypothetical protein ACH5RR_015992 [Cinchona calisaya]|uniref:Uncharacterized protein n=1 Tax=Cinchona calisaya TaxID=153742 RepID=A0ABD3A058_9GENT
MEKSSSAVTRVAFEYTPTDSRIVIQQAQQEWMEFQNTNKEVQERSRVTTESGVEQMKCAPPELVILKINTTLIYVGAPNSKGEHWYCDLGWSGELVNARRRSCQQCQIYGS